MNQGSFSMDIQFLHNLYDAIHVVHHPAKLSKTISQGLVKTFTN
jgi:hypothetical protein